LVSAIDVFFCLNGSFSNVLFDYAIKASRGRSRVFLCYQLSKNSQEKIEEASYFLFKVFHVYFREPGIFGKKSIFLASGNRLNQALQQVPEINAMIVKEE